MSAAHVTVSTTQFEFAHGRKPRGEGGWAFYFGRSGGTARPLRWYQGLYSQAKRDAVSDAVATDVTWIEVGS